MTQELFELLRQEGIRDSQSLDTLLLEDFTPSQLLELNQQLHEAVEAAHPTPHAHDLTRFDFWPNGELAGSLGGCAEAGCRSSRMERLARFATMWADSVHISGYFPLYRPEDAEDLRTWLHGSLKAMLVAEPAIKAGIVRLTSRHPEPCSYCDAGIDGHLKKTNDLLERASQSALEIHVPHVKVQFQADQFGYCLDIQGPDDLLPHGGAILTQPTPPSWLPTRIRRRAEAGEDITYDVPPQDVPRSGALQRLIEDVADDIYHQHLAARITGTKYLTHRPVDVDFLAAINDNDSFAAWNAVLAQHLQYEMPILSGIPLEDLIELRTKDYDAFLVYRDTLKSVIREHVAGRPAITGKEAAQIYDDVVRPELSRMSHKLAAVQARLSSKLRRNVIIATGILGLGLGLFSGLVLPPLALSSAAAVPSAISAAKTALERADASDELKSDNLYFLWKAAQRSRPN